MLDKFSFIRYNIGKRQWRKLLLGLAERLGSYLYGGEFPRRFFWGWCVMRELSVFC